MDFSEYKKKIVEYGVRQTSEQQRNFWEEYECGYSFLAGYTPEETVDDEISYWDE